MSSKRTPKRKLAVDSLVSTTGTKKPRASTTRKSAARSGEQEEQATTGQNGGTIETQVEWTHGEETVTTTTITERTISLRNKTITTPALSRSTSRTSKKTLEASSAMDIAAAEDDASWKDDGDGENMDIASVSDASDLATPVKRLYRRSSVGGAASVDDSASRPTNRRRTSAGASAPASEHAHSQDALPAPSSSRRRRAPAADADSDAGSLVSEAHSVTSAAKSARARPARGAASAQAATVMAVTSHALSAPAPSTGYASSSSSKSRSTKKQPPQSQLPSVVATTNHMATVVLSAPSLPAIVDVPAAQAAAPQEPPAINVAPAAAEADTSLESAGVAGGIQRRLRIVTAMAAQHYLSAVLVLLLLAVAVLYRQHSLQPSASVKPVPADFKSHSQNQTSRDSNRTFLPPTFASDQLLAELLAQQEDLRRVSEQLESARQHWNNASSTASQSATLAAESHANSQLLFVKLREDNIVLGEQLHGAEQQLEAQLEQQQRAVQAEAEASSALATKIEASIADLKPVIRELDSEAHQLHSLVETEVASLQAMAGSLNVTADHKPSSDQADLSTAHEALKHAVEQVARSSAALNETVHGAQLSPAQAAVQAAEARQEHAKEDFAAAQRQHQQDAAAVLEKATQAAQAAQKMQEMVRAQQDVKISENKEEVEWTPAEEPSAVHLTESASAAIIKQAAAEALSEPLRAAQEAVERAQNATLAKSAEELQREQETLLQGSLSQAAAAEESKSRKLPKLVQHSEPEQADVDVQGTDVAEVEEDLHQRHDYAVGPRGGQVLHHRYMCPAFGGSQLTSPPFTNHNGGGAGQPFAAITEALGSVAATFKRGVTHRGSVTGTGSSSSRVSRHSAEARVLVSHLRPVADHYYAMSTKRLHSATSSVHKVQGLLSGGGRGGDQGDSPQEGFAGQVTILLQEAVYVESVKLVTATAAAAGEEYIPACAPETFRLVGWTEDPRKLRDVRGKQFELGTHVFDSPQPSRDYGPTDVSASITSGGEGSEGSGREVEGSGGGTSSQVWEQQFVVPVEYEGVTVPALKAVTVHVLSNYGEKEFTCLHRVQIIGVLEQFLYH